jgi:hypothetical protein
LVNNSIRKKENNMKCNCGKGGKCSCGGMAKKKKPAMSKGGMMKKKGYAKGGMVKCGASNPASRSV